MVKADLGQPTLVIVATLTALTLTTLVHIRILVAAETGDLQLFIH